MMRCDSSKTKGQHRRLDPAEADSKGVGEAANLLHRVVSLLRVDNLVDDHKHSLGPCRRQRRSAV